MFFVVFAVLSLYPKYTSVYLCIRVIMTFMERQQMTVGVFCMCIFVQYDFIELLSILFNILLVLLVRPLVYLYE